MIANTSEVLRPFCKGGDVYRGAVFPSRTPTKGVCKQYVNVTHRLDPVAFVNEFDPQADFGDGRTKTDNVYHSVKLEASDITDKNIHAIEHYFKHPAVHAALFQYLLPGSIGAPSAEEMNTALERYRQETLTKKVTNVWRDSLRDLKNEPSKGFKQIFDLWEKFGDLIK
jgi:hypothetical protein